jgi:GNAT superfamily N-acetyltransferase
MKLTFHPLKPERWSDFETLFGARGACGGCWCMYWRLPPKDFKEGKKGGNKNAMRELVCDGRVTGILAYNGKTPVGWCSVEPRQEFPTLTRSRVLKAVDDVPVWSVSCLYVEKSHRGKGVSVDLLRAAVKYVAKCGGRIVEGYPVEPKTDSMPDAFAWTGLASAFLKAGFKEHHRGSPSRPIMRCDTSKSPARRR